MDQKRKLKVVIAVIAVLICGVIYLVSNDTRSTGEVVTEHFSDATEAGHTEEQLVRQDSTASQDSDVIYIHICGEVKKPGVYTFSNSPRLIEVVECAGGFTKKADCAAINQAESVADGSRITIPSKSRKTEEKEEDETSSGGKININTASQEELMTLNGIGEAKASQIIAYRETNGAFQKIDDIMDISGIKEGIFSKIKDFIIV